jgi:hypothetical protein
MWSSQVSLYHRPLQYLCPRYTFLCHVKFIYQHLSDSRLFAWLRQIPCNHHFLCGIIQTRDVMSWWGPRTFQLNSSKNFKDQVRKLVSKRRVKSVKEGVIGHIVMEHPQNGKWLKLLGKTQILPK